MNRMIVSVFDTEGNAYVALNALNDLHWNGDITLYATAVVNKNEFGTVRVKETSDEGPIGTAVGSLSGALIGIVGGPAGMAVGAAVGMLGGMFYDVNEADTDISFVDDVSALLGRGQTAVIADVEEGWSAPVDILMVANGGVVFRLNRNEVIDDQFDREVDAINEEMDELKAELKEANDDAKASIQKQIDKVKDKGHAMKVTIDKKVAEVKAEAEAKKNQLDKQIKEAKDKAKAKLEKTKADLHAKSEKRKEKLEALSKKVSDFFKID